MRLFQFSQGLVSMFTVAFRMLHKSEFKLTNFRDSNDHNWQRESVYPTYLVLMSTVPMDGSLAS